jgi:hypothetical protein
VPQPQDVLPGPPSIVSEAPATRIVTVTSVRTLDYLSTLELRAQASPQPLADPYGALVERLTAPGCNERLTWLGLIVTAYASFVPPVTSPASVQARLSAKALLRHLCATRYTTRLTPLPQLRTEFLHVVLGCIGAVGGDADVAPAELDALRFLAYEVWVQLAAAGRQPAQGQGQGTPALLPEPTLPDGVSLPPQVLAARAAHIAAAGLAAHTPSSPAADDGTSLVIDPTARAAATSVATLVREQLALRYGSAWSASGARSGTAQVSSEGAETTKGAVDQLRQLGVFFQHLPFEAHALRSAAWAAFRVGDSSLASTIVDDVLQWATAAADARSSIMEGMEGDTSAPVTPAAVLSGQPAAVEALSLCLRAFGGDADIVAAKLATAPVSDKLLVVNLPLILN